jgi:hypothetical protein
VRGAGSCKLFASQRLGAGHRLVTTSAAHNTRVENLGRHAGRTHDCRSANRTTETHLPGSTITVLFANISPCCEIFYARAFPLRIRATLCPLSFPAQTTIEQHSTTPPLTIHPCDHVTFHPERQRRPPGMLTYIVTSSRSVRSSTVFAARSPCAYPFS